MDLSDYFKSLDTEHSHRYIQKISVINVYPYLVNIEECSKKMEDYPKILYPDIVNYLLYTKSAYTFEDLKAYKGLDAYKQAANGWVREICLKKFDKHILILGKVLHSQKLKEAPLKPWVICKESGSIESAHCDCVAGLGETCTHVSALLFAIEMSMHKLDVSKTDVLAHWNAPSKVALPDKVANIKFKEGETDQELLIREKQKKIIPPMNKEEIVNLLGELKDTPRGSVLHAIVLPFSKNLQKEVEKSNQYVLTGLHKVDYETLSLEELRELGTKLNLKIPIEEYEKIEKLTNKQASSRDWFRYRAGRITASKFKQACSTKIANPSISLIKSICYPFTSKFKTTATIYGCEHEKRALKDYMEVATTNHLNFGGEPVGWCLNPNFPQFGASPDGLISCDCCGMGCIEIKCPLCAKDVGLEDLHTLKKIGITTEEGVQKLSEKHAYYYQIQMQLAIAGLDYCDFVVWSKENFYLERILPNDKFWETNSTIALHLFKQVILPELLEKYYTKARSESPTTDWPLFDDNSSTEEMDTDLPAVSVEAHVHTPDLYCICRSPDDGSPMIACGNEGCTVMWYHLRCIGLNQIPD